tara:strand:+ start:476 stop:736 length:261 start_codon:yes stop_codon:yes gene_type:complete
MRYDMRVATRRSRVTRRRLHSRLERVNEMFNSSLQLNHNPFSEHGGWQLTSKNGSHIEYHRVSAKEMLALLDGMSGAYHLQQKKEK